MSRRALVTVLPLVRIDIIEGVQKRLDCERWKGSTHEVQPTVAITLQASSSDSTQCGW